MNHDDLCAGGVTLRSLLENKEYLAMPARAKLLDKDDKETCNAFCDAAAAFLGPNLWDKTLSDFKLEYVDLDDILGSNASEELQRKIHETNASRCAENSSNLMQLSSQPTNLQGMLAPRNPAQPYGQHSMPPQPVAHHVHHISPASSPQRVPSTTSCDLSDDPMQMSYSSEHGFSSKDMAIASPRSDGYDPSIVPLQDEVLKPTLMIKKSQKHFVPDNLKDDKYWARRRKNNLAAKRSREARRVKENQIVLRASFLEKENNTLKDEVLRLKAENDMLRTQLKKPKH